MGDIAMKIPQKVVYIHGNRDRRENEIKMK
jgi:hypothetical protein